MDTVENKLNFVKNASKNHSQITSAESRRFFSFSDHLVVGR